MPLPEDVDLLYVPQSAAEIRDAFLTDYRLGLIEQGVANPAIGPGSEPFIRATAFANSILGLYANIEISAQDSSELTATGDKLDEIRFAVGLPEIPPSGAAGKLKVTIIGAAPALLPDKTEFVLPNGLRGQTAGSKLVSNGQTVDVIATDTGDATNTEAGTKVKWVSPPLNVDAEAEVDVDGLTGGFDAESDERKRERILDHRRFVPGGGNWAQLVEIAEASTASVQKAFAYPALGGPSSAKVVVTKAVSLEPFDLSRSLGAASLAIVENAVFAEMPTPMEIVVQTVSEVATKVAIQLSLPSANSQGTTQGWVNTTPFPVLEVADAGRVSISAISGNKYIPTITANTAVAPTDGETKITWFCRANGKSVTATVTSHAGSAGAWILSLDQPLISDGNQAEVGDLISTAAHNFDAYSKTFIGEMNLLGPGENTTDANRLPRSLRHPYATEKWSTDLTAKQISALLVAHTEISDASYGWISPTSTGVPANEALEVYIRRLNDFAIYPT